MQRKGKEMQEVEVVLVRLAFGFGLLIVAYHTYTRKYINMRLASLQYQILILKKLQRE